MMERQDWDGIGAAFADQVFQITDHDTRGVLQEAARRLGGSRKCAGDFGCGTGAVTRLLAGHFREVIGLDHAPRLVREAERSTTAPNVSYAVADLAGTGRLDYRFDASFCVNVLIHPDHPVRESIAGTVAAHTRPGAPAVFVVPSLESVLRTYQIAVDCQVRGGVRRGAALRAAERQAGEEIASVVDGIVSVGDACSKHYLADELAGFLERAGFRLQAMERVEYPWDQELDHPPANLGRPTPWDWLAECRRKRR